MTTIPRPGTGSGEACCEEYSRLSRRGLLAGAAALAGSATVIGGSVVTASPASATVPARAVLVVLSLRGAADGMSLMVPHGDPVYYAARPTIAVPFDSLLVRDAMFGLHPALAPLLPLWEAGRLAGVHATGMPAPNRSHFAAMEEVEDADPGSSERVGWLNRLIGLDDRTSPLQAFNMGGGVPPTSLFGPERYLSSASVDEMTIPGDDEWDPDDLRVQSLHRMWDGNTTAMGNAMRATFDAVEDFAPARATPTQPAHGAQYPDNDLGRSLHEVARIIRGNVGTEVITVDQGDWDHHTGLGTVVSGRMMRNAGDLARAVAALFQDLGDLADKVTLVTMSEFGRRVQENASRGLDHGYGNVMFVAGAGVNGGYHATWPDLTNQVDSDLTVTTDYRSVLAEIVTARFGVSSAAVFPAFTPQSVGVMVSA